MYNLITIAIPTYNGSETLPRLLDSIIDSGETKIEIVVSDNASTDNTKNIVERYMCDYDYINYFRNEQNVGYDNNVDLAVRNSTSEYVWIIGDDDYIEKDAITKVINILEENNDLAFIYVNFSIFNQRKQKYVIDKYSNIDNDMYFHSGNEFFSNVHLDSNFVSTNIFKRKLWINHDFSSYYASGWIHIAALLHILGNNSAFCISMPYVVNAGDRDGLGSAITDGVALELMIELTNIITEFDGSEYNNETIKMLKKDTYNYLSKKIVSAKINGLRLNRELFHKLFRSYGGYPAFWARDVFLLIIPNWILKILWKAYRIIWERFIWKKNKKYREV